MCATPFLKLNNVGKTYGSVGIWSRQTEKKVLTDINLTLSAQQSVALVGASGSGKSTLCRLILGLEPVSQGDILFKGKALSSFNRTDWKRYWSQVQLVFQDSISAVNPRQSVQQVLSEPLVHLRGLSRTESHIAAMALLEQVELPRNLMSKKAGQLSGGQLQRVCIARALAAKPKLIALDESLSGLDVVLQQQIIALLQRIQQQEGTAILLVTHDLRLVNKFCQQVVVLDGGKIVEQRAVVSTDHSVVSRETAMEGGKCNTAWTSEMGQRLNEAILPAKPQKAVCEPKPEIGENHSALREQKDGTGQLRVKESTAA